MPQKNPFGNTTPEDELNCTGALAGVAVLALGDPLHPENTAGSPAAALAPRID